METSSHSLSIESFSHSWSVNPEGSFRGSDEASFIEMESPLALLHADELISNGFLVPLFAQPIKSDSFDRAFDSPQQPTKQDQVRSSDEIRCAPLKRCQRLSRRIFRRYLDVIRPICVKLRRFGFAYGRRSSRAEERKRYEFSGAVSTGAAYSDDNWRRSCDSESSIHEAVLHCKRTIVGDK
ncbi:PREDICTED: probable membrane-associated kinase regulator 6 isoform X2 [Ipomoea nil]|uniref:probable membrane-associated kinase regulator 6 isoform X2 n=1 Tax=Ipomoea nil TaxID=35883 RepID=UPI000900ADF2|nr:PREDICTED: probable membrane-associated kinase regulator 6 isoform X2 [Ipomoea nil]